jgi:hypothetical protein
MAPPGGGAARHQIEVGGCSWMRATLCDRSTQFVANQHPLESLELEQSRIDSTIGDAYTGSTDNTRTT